MASNDTIRKTITVTVLLCLVCSIVVSTAAVVLRPLQVANQELDIKRNILSAAGLLDSARGVEAIFNERVTPRLVELDSGTYSDDHDVDSFDQWRAARQPELSTNLSRDEDTAGIRRREDYAVVYLVEDEQGELDSIILPVRGYGLWSTMYGFLALESDASTVRGIGFYDHGETPGLGGEIDNPRWQSQWEGKSIYDDSREVAFSVEKGRVDPSSPQAEHKVDALSGATLTSRGVQNLVHFWLGEQGFKPYLTNLLEGEA